MRSPLILTFALSACSLSTEPCDQKCWHVKFCAEPRYSYLRQCAPPTKEQP